MAGQAFVSLATNDDYAKGALALGRSLRDSSTSKMLVLLVTNGVSPHARDLLKTLWDELVNIEELDSRDWEHLNLLNRPELGVTFTKLHAWRLVRFQKCVFLDADTLVLCNVDELFEREEFSAAPDVGWPDCFNSGVFVYKPSMETFANLRQLSMSEGSFDGGDQGLLNSYWSDWATKDIKYHLPFIYNVTPNMYYQYAPAYKRFGKNARIIHFIGPLKPWHHTYIPESDTVIPIPHSAYQHSPENLRRWWQAYQATLPQPQYPSPPVSSSHATGSDPMDVPTGGTGQGGHVHHSSSVPTWHHDQNQAPSPHHHHQGPPAHNQHGSTQAHHHHQGPPAHNQHGSTQAHHHHQGPPTHNQHGGTQAHHHQHASVAIPRHHSLPSSQPTHHHGTSPVPMHARSPTPRYTTHSQEVQRQSSSREASLEPPMARRRRAWQRGEIDYLGADSFEAFIGPQLGTNPVDRRLAWERGEIDYMGEDNYDILIERLINDTLHMHVMDDEDNAEDNDEVEDDEVDNRDMEDNTLHRHVMDDEDNAEDNDEVDNRDMEDDTLHRHVMDDEDNAEDNVEAEENDEVEDDEVDNRDMELSDH